MPGAGLLGGIMRYARAAARRVAPVGSGAWPLALVVLGVAASCQVNTLFATAFQSVLGTDNGQPLSALSTLDESGTANDWGRYLAFYPGNGGYQGVFTFQLPGSVPRNTVGALYVGANYKGQPASAQRWTFDLLDTTTQQWVTVGDNGAVTQNGVWTTLQTNVTADVVRFVAGNGAIQLRYATTSTLDSSKLDFLALGISGSGAVPPAPTGGLRKVFQGSYSRDDSQEVDFVAAHDLHVIGVGPNKLDELRQANPNLTALYYIKIAGVHGPETRPPSGDPQWAQAVAQNLLWKAASGNYVRNTTNGWYYINIQDPTKRAKWWALQKSVLGPQMAYYDGLYFDNTTTITSDFEDLVTEPPVGYDETAYYDGLYSLLSSARSEYPGKTVFFNTYAGWETPGFRGVELLPMADGMFFEGFSYKVRAGLFDKPRLLQQLADFASVVRGGKHAVALDYAAPTDIARRTFSLACYMLVANDNALHFFSSPEVDSDVQQWPEDDLDIGAPQSEYVLTTSGLLQRDFSGGRVLVNPEDTVSLPYVVDATRREKLVLSGGGAWPAAGSLSWQPVSGTITVPPMTGLVLRASG